MDRESLEDLFQPFGRVFVRRMFGGYGIFADGVMFALFARGQLFLKADEASARRFADAGCDEFLYRRGDRTISLGYWTMPDDALDDATELIAWSGIALEVARRKKAAVARGKQPRHSAAVNEPGAVARRKGH